MVDNDYDVCKSAKDFYREILKPAFEEALENKQVLFIDMDDTLCFYNGFISGIFRFILEDFDLLNIRSSMFFKSEQQTHYIGIIEKELGFKLKYKLDVYISV
jgi:hypothetical protein